MAVVDESAGGKSRPNWNEIRREYEQTRISQRAIAKKYGVSKSTVMKRAMREKWKQGARLVRATSDKLEAIANEIAQEKVATELAPWIEEMKTRITKRGFALGESGIDRVEALWRKVKPENPKGEADAARAAETFLRMARTSLGMGDNTGAIGNLNVQILTNQAQIAVATQ